MIEIKKVNRKHKKELRSFIDFPHDLYAHEPNYVPEIFIGQRDLLTKSPFLKHSELELFLAYENGKIVGRIAAILNNNHNIINHANDGFFGFFDAENNQEVVDALFKTAEEWLKQKKVDKIVGPVNPSTNETCGTLIEGFDEPPVAMMTYNFPYYQGVIENCGYHKQTDLLAYKIDHQTVGDKPIRLMDAVRTRLEAKGITIRHAHLKDFDSEVSKMLKIYNQAWDKNLDFVPMTDEEFKYMAKDLKMIADEKFCLIAEDHGSPIGFALAIPDINQVQIKVKRGRLFPTGIFKLLLGKKKINVIRIITLGVLEPYRKLGIEAVFYGSIIKKGLEKGIKWAEGSWILEDNVMMNRGFKSVNGQVYKRYRLFEKEINS